MHTISTLKRSLFSLISLAFVCLVVPLGAQRLEAANYARISPAPLPSMGEGSPQDGARAVERKVVKPPLIPLPAILTCGEDHAVKQLNAKGVMTPIGAHENSVTALAFSSAVKGNLLVSGDAGGVYKVWNLAQNRLLLEQKAYDKAIRALAISPDGKTIATASDDGRLRLWERTTGKQQFDTAFGQPPVAGLFYAQDGKTLFLITSTALQSWRVVNLLNGANHLYPEPNQEFGAMKANAAALSPDGTRIALACEDSYVRIWSLAAKREETKIRVSEFSLTAIAWTPDGQWVAPGDSKGNIRIWKVATGEARLFLCRAGGAARGVGFSADGKALAAATSKGAVRYFETTGGVTLMEKPVHLNGISRLIVLP